MNTSHQPQQNGSASQPASGASSTPWEGDQMLHIYVCDYLRKRGFEQAAQALRYEAGLDPHRRVPIDAPQSLLFEWWVVFWEVFAARSRQPNTAADASLSADAQTYSLYRPPGLADATNVVSNGPPLQPTSNSAAPVYTTALPQTHRATPAAAQSTALARRRSQVGFGGTETATETEKPNNSSEASSSMQVGSSAQASPRSLQEQQQRQRRASLTAIPQLDLEVSQKLGLARPASRVVIQQCMDMMNLGGAKEIDQLTAKEKQALSKRVTRLQTAQNDAQLRLAQLHGLQPPKPLMPASLAAPQTQPLSPSSARMQPEATSPSATAFPHPTGQKRKQSPNAADADGNRLATAAAAASGPGLGLGQQLQQGQPMRRLSYPAAGAAPSIPSPLTPVNGSGGGLPFSQFSPHPAMQQPSPASSAPTPMAHPMLHSHQRHPSVLASEPAVLQAATSPHKMAMHASGLASASPLPASSASPLGEWHTELQQQQQQQQQQQRHIPPPLQQQPQRPVVMASSLDKQPFQPQVAQPAYPQPAVLNGSHPAIHPSAPQPGYPQVMFSGLPSGTANARPPPPPTVAAAGKDSTPAPPPMYQRLAMPAHAKPSVFGAVATNNGAISNGNGAVAFNAVPMMHQPQQQQQHPGGPSAPMTPLADLGYDWSVLLSNSSQVDRDETSALARQFGNVGGS